MNGWKEVLSTATLPGVAVCAGLSAHIVVFVATRGTGKRSGSPLPRALRLNCEPPRIPIFPRIALTQPFGIDDVLIIENERGRFEEITLIKT